MENLNESQEKEMIDLCEQMLARSYCPYSKFAVASVLVAESGKIFTGCNVENASYGLCICAERTAAVKAVSEGFRKFRYCFVLTRSVNKVAPCGACRQFLAEFGLDLTLYLVGSDRKYIKCQLRDLLPNAFTPAELESGIAS